MAGLPVLFTVEEVAEALRSHPVSVHRWIASGAIGSCLVGGKRLISEADLDAFLASCRGPEVKRPPVKRKAKTSGEAPEVEPDKPNEPGNAEDDGDLVADDTTKEGVV